MSCASCRSSEGDVRVNRGERVQELVYDWLKRTYPDGPDWDDPGFICGLHSEIEIRMIPAFDAIEYNLANGGWAQFLWNCFGVWRQFIDTAQEGYSLISGREQSEALGQLRILCERDERECSEALQRSEQEDTGLTEDIPYFAEFTKRSYASRVNDWEKLFWSKSGIYQRRLVWLDVNEARVRKALSMLS
jgi:hypothetical protein